MYDISLLETSSCFQKTLHMTLKDIVALPR